MSVEGVRRVIRARLGNRAKETLLVDFNIQTDLDQIGHKASVIDAFFTFAQAEQRLLLVNSGIIANVARIWRCGVLQN